MNNIVSLILGDPSGDGHDKRDVINISSNLNKKEMLSAYETASKKLKFDLINEVCDEYEDNLLSKNHLDILIKNGLKIEDLGITKKYKYEYDEAVEAFDDEDSDGLNLWNNTYTHLFLFIVKLGNKDFEFKILDGELNPTINIGGYGLFT